MYDRLNKQILAHQGHSEQKLKTKESPQTNSTDSIVEEQNPQQPSLENNTLELQQEPVTKITNSSPINGITIAGEGILLLLIITPFLLTWIKTAISH